MEPVKDKDTFTFTQAGVGSIVFHPGYYHPMVGCYEYFIELQLLSGQGGAAGLGFARDCVTWMFNNTKALWISGIIESSNMSSRQFGTALQFDNVGEADGWTHWRVSIKQWISRRGGAGLEAAEARRPDRWK